MQVNFFLPWQCSQETGSPLHSVRIRQNLLKKTNCIANWTLQRCLPFHFLQIFPIRFFKFFQVLYKKGLRTLKHFPKKLPKKIVFYFKVKKDKCLLMLILYKNWIYRFFFPTHNFLFTYFRRAKTLEKLKLPKIFYDSILIKFWQCAKCGKTDFFCHVIATQILKVGNHWYTLAATAVAVGYFVVLLCNVAWMVHSCAKLNS